MFKLNIYMKKHLSVFKRQKGFTLIELLVVIGILGVLAAALIATIDPFEQLKKAQDSSVQNAAVEFVDANVRYYTGHNSMPWAYDTNCLGGSNNPSSTSLDSLMGCVQALVSEGELKAAFTTATNALTSVMVTGATNSVTACFAPQSKSMQRNSNTRYTQSGSLRTDCAGQTSGGATDCFWCAL
jgi:prepilin-type N-terminal cleavage/methylation domain-containing protein